jgi:hypothetical protein
MGVPRYFYHMPKGDICEELEASNTNGQAVMQVRTKRSEQDPKEDHPLTTHFILSMVRGPDVVKVLSH